MKVPSSNMCGRRPGGGSWPRAAALAIALLAASLACGCDAAAWILVHTIGPFVPEDEIKAEYDLKGRSVLVLVDKRDPMLSAAHPRVEAALAKAIGDTLAARGACGPLVEPHSVEAARRAEPDFDKWSVAQVGKYFNVDVVLHVELFEFRLRDNPSSNVFRGYAEAAMRLVLPETGEQAWPVLAAARVITAETLPDADVEETGKQERLLTEGFGEKIARQFYTYKVSELPLRPKVK